MMIEGRTLTPFENPYSYAIPAPADVILSGVRLTGVLQVSVDVAGPWAVRLPHDPDTILLYVIEEGRCTVMGAGLIEPLELGAGDVLILPQPVEHVMADRAGLKAKHLADILPQNWIPANSGEAFLSGVFASHMRIGDERGAPSATITTMRMFTDRRAPQAFLKGFPAFNHLPGFAAREAGFFQTALRAISACGTRGMVGQAVATRLAESVLTLCLQACLRDTGPLEPGLQKGLKDPVIAKALGLIHGQPGGTWTIESLSKEVGLSRTALRKRFIAMVGMNPHNVLTLIRMNRATELLQKSHLSLAQVAMETGYGSEAAFHRAYRRWSGVTPGYVRRSHAEPNDPNDQQLAHRGK
jgi:AraC-like DNA-binding protein